MKRIKILLTSALLAVASPLLFAGELGLDNIPLPKKTMVLEIAHDVEFNQVGMSAWDAKFARPVNEVLQFYRNQWSNSLIDGAPGFVENDMGDWKIISRLDGEILITVQVKAKNRKRSEGILAISNLPEFSGASGYGKHFPKPSHTVVQNDITSTDGAVDSRTLIMESKHPVKTVARFYDQYYQQKGWVRQGMVNEGAVYKKGDKEVNLAMVRKNNLTRIIVVETKS